MYIYIYICIYIYIYIDKFIRRKQEEFKDARNRSYVDKLNNELYEVTQILTEDLSYMMDRENTLLSIQYN